jgi:WD40 repeat protein
VLSLVLAFTGIGAGAVYLQALGEPPLAQPVQEAGKKSAAQNQARAVKPVRLDHYGDPLPEGALARLGTARLRHGDGAQEVRFAPDGQTMASAGQDHTVRIWDCKTGKEVRTFAGHKGMVWSVAYAPDGKVLASSSADTTVRLWEVDTGKELRVIQGFETEVLSVAFAPDGKYLAASCRETVRLWESATGKHVRTWKIEGQGGVGKGAGGLPFAGGAWPTRSIVFSPDGKLLAGANENGLVYVWEVATGKEHQRLVGHEEGVESVAWFPDGKSLASGSRDGTVLLWNVATGKKTHTLKGHEDGVWAVAISTDGKFLASGSFDRTVRLWDLEKKKELRALPTGGSVWSVAFSPDGKQLAATAAVSLKLWEVATGKDVFAFGGHPGDIRFLAFSADGAVVASAAEDWTVRLWDRTTGKELRQFEGASGPIAFSPDDKQLATYFDREARLLDTATGRLVRRVPAERGYHWFLRYSPNGKLFVAGYEIDRGLWWLDPVAEKVVFTAEKSEKLIGCIAISPDGKTLVTGGTYDRLRYWAIDSRKQIMTSEELPGGARSVAYSPDGKLLASAGGEDAVQLWNAATGKLVRNLAGHKYVYPVAFSPDGKLLASGGQDQKVRLWEVATGKLAGILHGHSGSVWTLAFSANSQWLVSGGGDASALVWDLRAHAGDGRKRSLAALWDDLAGEDAVKARQAGNALVSQGRDAASFLGGRLKPVADVDPQHLGQLIAALDSEQFPARQQAREALEQLGELAAPALRKVLEDKPGLDKRQQVEQLLARLETRTLAGEELRAWRALTVLEHIGTPEARQVLDKLAQGASGHPLTEEARSAVRRLIKK